MTAEKQNLSQISVVIPIIFTQDCGELVKIQDVVHETSSLLYLLAQDVRHFYFFNLNEVDEHRSDRANSIFQSTALFEPETH